MNKKNLNSGFTLIELLICMTIIGILSSVVITGLNGGKEKARDSVRIRDLNTLSKAVELYFAEHGGEFPNNLDEPEMKDYFTDDIIPTDPKTDRVDRNYAYAYNDTSSPKQYCLGAIMEVTQNFNTEVCGGGINLGSEINYIIKGP